MHTDIETPRWIEKIPEKWRPYVYLARLDRPIGVWLLLLPAWWGIALASSSYMGFGVKMLYMLLIFMVGAIVMRAAGCVINDMWDRSLDQKVERTRTRPLASGALDMTQAAIFLACLLMTGFVILLTMNGTTIILGLLSLPLIIAYPFMKRLTYWPQAFLGLTFNFGALMGWSAMTDMIILPALLLYLGAIFWTIGYDTVYAHQDKEDDAIMGVKSTALKFGDQSKIWVAGFYSAAWVLISLAILMSGLHILAAVGIAGFGAHFVWQLKNWDLHDHESSLKTFKSNRDAGLIVFAAMLLGGL